VSSLEQYGYVYSNHEVSIKLSGTITNWFLETVCLCYNVRHRYVQNLIWKTTRHQGLSRNWTQHFVTLGPLRDDPYGNIFRAF